MSDMKKLLQIVTESGEKARIDEGVNVSINVSGDSPCDVGEVLAKVTNLSSPRPVTPDMMPAPSAPPPMPMMKAIDIVGKADEPKNPPMHPTMPPMAPETMGQDPMMPDPSEEEAISTGGIMNPPAGQSGGAGMGSVEMGGDQAELEALISQAEEDLGLSEQDPEDDEEDDNPYDTVDDIPDHRYNESPMDLTSILKKHSLAFASWKRGGDIQDDPEFFQDLFDYYSDEMPYGVQKGREGDPAYWIDNQLSQEIGGQDESLLDPAMGSAHGEGSESKALTMNSSYKDIHDRLREIDRALAKKNEEFKNEPNPSMKDTNYMTKDLAGGLNKPKTMHKHSYKQGDNPMAMEATVRSEWEKYKLGE